MPQPHSLGLCSERRKDKTQILGWSLNELLLWVCLCNGTIYRDSTWGPGSGGLTSCLSCGPSDLWALRKIFLIYPVQR